MIDIKTFPLEVHQDHRGLLLGNLDKDLGKQIQHFFVATINPGKSRGKHYHNKKKEWFIILGGKVKLDLVDIKSNEKRSIILDSNDHLIYEMPPGIVHSFKNISKTTITLLALVNEFLNKNKPDTYII